MEDKANELLDNFVGILEKRGIRVDRPTPLDFSQAVQTPDWEQGSMFGCIPPRDVLLTVGSEILNDAGIEWLRRHYPGHRVHIPSPPRWIVPRYRNGRPQIRLSISSMYFAAKGINGKTAPQDYIRARRVKTLPPSAH